MSNIEIVTAALAVQGWKSPAELEWLCGQAAAAKLIIDVGCWRGQTTLAMWLATAGRIIAVDRATGKYSGDVARNLILKGTDRLDIQSDFARELAPGLASGRVRVVYGDGPEAYQSITDMLYIDKPFAGNEVIYPDFIFIDGDHGYNEVYADLKYYRGILARGGTLAGHDYEKNFPGVVRAVHAICPGAQKGPGSIWFWRAVP